VNSRHHLPSIVWSRQQIVIAFLALLLASPIPASRPVSARTEVSRSGRELSIAGARKEQRIVVEATKAITSYTLWPAHRQYDTNLELIPFERGEETTETNSGQIPVWS
jgi:hypothetical protein